MAIVGQADEISRRGVAGWAADTENPRNEVEIVILVNGAEVGRVRANEFRKGLDAVVPGSTGRHGFEFKFDPELRIYEDYRIEVKLAGTDNLLAQGLKNLPRPALCTSSLVPILITSSGRAGSTLLMRYLSQFPEVVTGSAYPYELKLANYYSAAFSVLAADENRKHSTDPDTMFDPKFRYMIGSNPYTQSGHHGESAAKAVARHFFDERVPTLLAETFRTLLLEYYTGLKREQNKSSARYFAEKSSLDEIARKGPRIFFETLREIVLVRDPRDLLCSSKAFWKLSSDQALGIVVHACRRLEEIRLTADKDDTIVIKYEDLVVDRIKAMERIIDFIGVNRANSYGSTRDNELFEKHGTSKSPVSSVGRWRNDLSENEIEKCERYTRGYMSAFGYEVRIPADVGSSV
jgi:hypothetical protein